MRTCLNIPEEDLAAFDQVWRTEDFESRSRAAREAIQEHLEAQKHLIDVSEEIVALLAFDDEHHEVIQVLDDVQHDFLDVIGARNHARQGDWYLEAPFWRWPAGCVRELVCRLRDFDGVGRLKEMLLEQ